jgi:anti-anti-sigma factor
MLRRQPRNGDAVAEVLPGLMRVGRRRMDEDRRMRVERRPTPGDVGLLAVSGEFDMDGVALLDRAVADLHAAGTVHIVVDLSHTSFMDSSGINSLLRANRMVNGADGWLRLAGVREPVMEVIQLVGLDEVVAVYPDPERACRA